MIKEIDKKDITECVDVIKESFLTVADEFGFTGDDSPRFTAFSISEDRLLYQLENDDRRMYAYYDDNRKIVGYYSLALQDHHECELNNLCVLPQYRHKNIGKKLLNDACAKEKQKAV